MCGGGYKIPSHDVKLIIPDAYQGKGTLIQPGPGQATTNHIKCDQQNRYNNPERSNGTEYISEVILALNAVNNITISVYEIIINVYIRRIIQEFS